MAVDPRKEYILKRVETALGVKELSKLVSNEPPQFKSGNANKKCVVAFKTVRDVNLTADNVRDIVLFQEIVPKGALDILDVIADSVYSTPLSNAANQVGWSDLICNDTLDKFFSLRAQVQVTAGLMKSTTRLPLPPPMSAEKAQSSDRVHVLESAVILWTKQIRHVLKQDPEAQLKAGLHVGPNTEVEYWKLRKENLASIWEQLQQDSVKSLLKTLEANKSTYTEPFAKLQAEVEAARDEAVDNALFLKPLEPLIADLQDESAELQSLVELFPKLFHTILLIWTHSRYYHTPPRLVVLVREICNQVIARVELFVNGSNLLNVLTDEDPAEATSYIDNLQQALNVCRALKETFAAYKAKADRLASADGGAAHPAGNWKKVQNHALFSRLDTFRERVRDVLDLSTTILQFARLKELTCIGGSKGDLLSKTVESVCRDFHDRVASFKTEQDGEDVLAIADKSFDTRLFALRGDVKDLERKLAAVLTTAFDDAETISSRLKLFESFEPVLTRPIMQDEVDRKYALLLEQFKQDVKAVQQLFLANRHAVDSATDECPLYANMPPVAGSIFWARSLEQRVTEPLARITSFTHSMRGSSASAEGGDVPEDLLDSERLTSALVNLMREYEAQRLQKWENEQVVHIRAKLQNFLLKRSEDNLLKVNFSPELVALLREVRYFRLLGIPVPALAEELYGKAETYRKNTEQFDEIAQKYNAVLTDLFPIEEPLLAKKLEAVDEMLRPGLDAKRWSEEDLTDFISNSLSSTNEVALIVDSLKENLKLCSAQIHTWNKTPLIDHKSKPMAPEDFEAAYRTVFNNRQAEIAQDGKEIHKHIRNSADALRVTKNSQQWVAYTEFVTDVIQEGIAQVVRNSMNRMCFLLDPAHINKTDLQPIFETRLYLRDDQDAAAIVMDPPFDYCPAQNSVRDVVSNIAKSFFTVGTVVQRIDNPSGTGNNGDFLVDLREDMRLQGSLAQVSYLVDSAQVSLDKFCSSFNDFQFLWTGELEQDFSDFLADDRNEPKELVKDPLNPADKTQVIKFRTIMSTIKLDVGPAIPDASVFESEIQRLEAFALRIAQLKTEVDIHFMRISIGPLNDTLKERIARWINKYKTFLQDHVNRLIDQVDLFISNLEAGLRSADFDDSVEQTEEDRDRLYRVMTHVRDQKLANLVLMPMLEPIKSMVAALKRLSRGVSEERLAKFEAFPAQWKEIEKLCYSVRERISGLQAQEALNIVKELNAFDRKLDAFEKRFASEGPVKDTITADQAYLALDSIYAENEALRVEARKNNDIEMLFDKNLSTYKVLERVQKNLTDIKLLWDFTEITRYTFDGWRATPFKALDDLELMYDRTRKLQAQFRDLPASVRGWPLYNSVKKEIDSMLISLPLVIKLKSDNVEDRHWLQLRKLCGNKPFDYESDSFRLRDLLDLNLHEKSNEVDEICDIAEKEAKNKVKISKIAARWDRNTFQVETKDDFPGVMLLASVESITEDLEGDAQEVLGLKAQGKSIEFIQEEVEKWDRYMTTVEACIKDWLFVQNEWKRLQPIFIGSEDIRNQLPSDTATFEEKVDRAFTTMMQDLVMNSKLNVITACCTDERHDTIKDIKEHIEKCTHALNEYLEQKKKMFPRFYFVSNEMLLTMLSNGNKPKKISANLSNCFDGIRCWLFDESKDPDGFYVRGMLSKEGEEIDFKDDPFIINKKEQVEEYLSRFERHMQKAMRSELIAARSTAENWDLGGSDKEAQDQAREKWLRHYSAQTALVASQIAWTEETARAFEELEGGGETAMKDYKRLCEDRLSKLIEEVLTDLENVKEGDLTYGRNLRIKIITLITIDVHARDVIEKFVQTRLSDSSAFAWLSQLRFSWANPKAAASDNPAAAIAPESAKDCVIRICDWITTYAYEYVGNCGRLVITPLTDRCYITLTQALNLTLGGAPAGPAGTGKTETTKDLARAIGLPVFVFNCSDQMDYKNTANIFMGLAQTGAWGCFDEFNRISVDVLSVVASQVKCILDAVTIFHSQEATRDENAPFTFKFTSNDEHISLRPTCGFFITMNPGYAGRSELPENLKALFRSCAMVVPDTMFICENMLMAEGFQCARELAHKFVTLYNLCKELLSKARHYDWGLRAVKAVLRQAGGLLRKAKSESTAKAEKTADGKPKKMSVAENAIAEQIVLKKALRDFNMPKIVVPDQPIFERLIEDLFPKLDAPKARDHLFEQQVGQRAVARDLQKVDAFCLKVAQLRDILEVRHCVFVLGPPGSAKSSVWRTLMDTLRENGEDGLLRELNPKAITTKELYGYQKDVWKDGVISKIMRDMSKEEGEFKASHKHKWIILDGDIDAVWIESMNTVMDDNKVLTLVSNERIAFQPSMRLIFEIENMREASPATVSRGGVLFINETDIGWRPFVDSWRNSFQDELARSVFDTLFTQHFEGQIDSIRKDLKFVATVYDIALVHSICHMVSALMFHPRFEKPIQELQPSPNMKKDAAALQQSEDARKFLYENFFCFAFLWTIGGAVQVSDRKAFSSRLKSWFKNCKLPELPDSATTFFDYKFDLSKEGEWGWFPWADYVDSYVHRPEAMFSNIIVPTVDTTRIHWVTDLHMRVATNKVALQALAKSGRDKAPGVLLPKPVLFIGENGTGKTVLARNYLRSLDSTMTSSTINLNHYTDSAAIQAVMEASLINLNQRTLAPPQQRKLIYFIDDLNMPEVDTYGTQVSLALLRQFMDYQMLFDRNDLSQVRKVVDCQFLACQNPKAGSFTINPQLQRHFTVISTAMNISATETQQASNIFGPILTAHLNSFDLPGVSNLSEKLINFLCKTYFSVWTNFVPTASKFHYNFNLRDISNVLEGVLNSHAGVYKGQKGLGMFHRLVIHELDRVFSDRMVAVFEREIYSGMVKKAFADVFPDPSVQDDVFNHVHKDTGVSVPNVFTSFVAMAGGNEKRYMPIASMDALKNVLNTKLNEYNEMFAQMPLVLFNDAMEHVARIARVIDTPAGNALLVGVGGSGKQSLSKLAIFVLGFDVYQIQVQSGFSISDLKAELQNCTTRAAVKPAIPTVLLVTDQQIVQERFLVSFNDFLSSGFIPELYNKEEFDGILSSLRNVAKAQGFADSPEGQLAFFIERTRRNMHMIICHSPVGDTLRVRGRRFPALISCTVIDWFQAWPRDALVDVAKSFIKDVEFDKPETLDLVADAMAEVHIGIELANQQYREKERRHNYTTPKSFLELIAFYKDLLAKKRNVVKMDKDRLSNGLETLNETASTVDDLKQKLAEDMERVNFAREKTNEAIALTTDKVEKASVEQADAQVLSEKTAGVAAAASEKKESADKMLSEARPAMEAAFEAVNVLQQAMISECKTLKTVNEKVHTVVYCVGLMTGYISKPVKADWLTVRKQVLEKKPPNAFKADLAAFLEDPSPEEECACKKTPESTITLIKQQLAEANVSTAAEVKTSSVAAANLYTWLYNCVTFWEIYQKVKPLMAEVATADAQKAAADAELKEVTDRLDAINLQVDELRTKEAALKAELAELEANAAASKAKLDLAERLVNGLASENHRWSVTVATLEQANVTLIGDSLLAACFVSYIGAFSSSFRSKLWNQQWLPNIRDVLAIPCSENPIALELLATKKDEATWKQNGLPADQVSLENAAIVSSCSRWPLIIDPQMQGIKWIKGQFSDQEDGLVTLQMNTRNVMNKIEVAMREGKRLLLESVPQELDATLEPLLSRAIVKNGKNFKINFNGNKDAEYDRNFRLFLQCKLPNPHYRPEVAAQCTLINFIVTPSGLEDQILAFVVDKEKPELEQQKQELVSKLNEYSVELFDLENKLLDQLMAATADKEKSILDNEDVVLSLERTKQTSVEISQKVEESKETEKEINLAREEFRPVAAEGSMLYFLLIELYQISPMYQFSLDAFNIFLLKGIEKAESHDEVKVRCGFLLESIRQTIFTWISRGLFEKDKLIFLTMLTFKLLERGQLIDAEKYDPVAMNFLLRGPICRGTKPETLDWLPDQNYFAVTELVRTIPAFDLFGTHLEKEAPGRFKEWFNELQPEEAKLPLDWKRLDQEPIKKMLVLRCLRPDRMAAAITNYIRGHLPNGSFYVDGDSGKNFQTVLSESLIDSTPTTPLFFILSPGADPIKEMEAIGRQHTPKMIMGVNLEAVSMGQGQDQHALNKLQQAHKEGGWVMLQNIHLMPKFLPELEKKLDEFAQESSHPNFRCFLSSDPIPESNTEQQIPIGILQRSIKLTNEPPAGLRANLDRALAFFPRDEFEENEAKGKSILFGLCYFHAVMLERKKFGAMGWNLNYPFAIGDLRDSAKVLQNYLQNQTKVPWEDLRYIFGEIMYGGHIVDARDRLLCTTYLDLYMREELLDSVPLFPFVTGEQAFYSPPPSSYERYKEHIASLPGETPIAYGLHPNAEIGFRTTQCENLFATLLRLMPVNNAAGADDDEDSGADTSGQTPQAIVQNAIASFLVRVSSDRLDVETVSKNLRADDKGPYQYVFLQECEYMNIILDEIQRSLVELQKGLEGKLSMSDRMEKLLNEIFLQKVPASWANVAYPSTRPLGSWFENLLLRLQQLQLWINEPTVIPKVVRVNLLINPQSFLTAIKQVNSQLFGNELNKLTILTEVTKRSDPKQIDGPAKEGAAYVSGFSLEGARWDIGNGTIEESRPKELFCPMPIICCNAKLETDKQERNVYQCPVYKTGARSATYVFTAQLRTKQPPAKWVLGGVAMILDTGVDAKDEA